MAEFLSDDWIAALDAAARRAPDLAVTDPFVVEQVVDLGAGRDVRYQVQFGPDGTRVTREHLQPADVELLADRSTAWSLHQGALRAQDAFAQGRLKVRGRPELLAGRAELFERLERAWAEVRVGTTAGDA
jgi:hypothetical protein